MQVYRWMLNRFIPKDRFFLSLQLIQTPEKIIIRKKVILLFEAKARKTLNFIRKEKKTEKS